MLFLLGTRTVSWKTYSGQHFTPIYFYWLPTVSCGNYYVWTISTALQGWWRGTCMLWWGARSSISQNGVAGPLCLQCFFFDVAWYRKCCTVPLLVYFQKTVSQLTTEEVDLCFLDYYIKLTKYKQWLQYNQEFLITGIQSFASLICIWCLILAILTATFKWFEFVGFLW